MKKISTFIKDALYSAPPPPPPPGSMDNKQEKENRDILVREMLKKLGISEGDLLKMSTSELRARIRDYNIDTILK